MSDHTGVPAPRPHRFRAGVFEYHEVVEVKIARLDHLGQGVGEDRGISVVVPFTLPGERVRARIWGNFKDHAEADLMEILDAFPSRVSANCAVFGSCSGCQLQMMSYPAQIAWKKSVIEELFGTALGKLPVAVNEPIVSPKQFAYRSKLTPHFHPPQGGHLPEIGFMRLGRGSKIVDVETCPIATEAINRELPRLRAQIAGQMAQYKKGATLLIREVQEGVVTDPNAFVTEKVGDKLFRFPAREFFQNNPFILPQFARYVVDTARGFHLPFLADIYCGSGFFSIMGAEGFQAVVGIEISTSSVQLARENAALNHLGNVEFLAGDAAAIFAQIAFAPGQTVVLIDPPRKGCSDEFLAQLAQFSPAGIVYVSCGPESQARDCGKLLEAGYSIRSIQPFDLFPQTRHIENVVVLEKKIALA
ncbi:class I SAM-dependent RNA methyltransferase [Kamptonema cortianum]|nr:class I SAM-dependent RNA methyltransferase [Oscillatoria laete-virens]MDK3156396.1 class I SAM-dependent RNA methyltransferase [Kamptonema cortianum]MDL5046252.1 class I SAM-dependent RNA methyltransferase [Oscillatoria amoena NRMC-F 0135]MDL5053923.1 class I SAM-dependent RNA methyltransferase [Oscillatoria laete-virens NRMC-F 0139]